MYCNSTSFMIIDYIDQQWMKDGEKNNPLNVRD